MRMIHSRRKSRLRDFPVAVGIDQRLVDGLFGEFIELALIEVITLRKLENFFAAIVAFCSTFNSRHCELLILVLVLSVGQHLTHGRRIGVRNDNGLAQFSFSFG